MSDLGLLFFGGPLDGMVRAMPDSRDYLAPVRDRSRYMQARSMAEMSHQTVRYESQRFNLGYPIVVEVMVAEGYPVQDIEDRLHFVAALARISWTWTGTSSTEETP